jgi:hypothetical protein
MREELAGVSSREEADEFGPTRPLPLSLASLVSFAFPPWHDVRYSNARSCATQPLLRRRYERESLFASLFSLTLLLCPLSSRSSTSTCSSQHITDICDVHRLFAILLRGERANNSQKRRRSSFSLLLGSCRLLPHIQEAVRTFPAPKAKEAVVESLFLLINSRFFLSLAPLTSLGSRQFRSSQQAQNSVLRTLRTQRKCTTQRSDSSQPPSFPSRSTTPAFSPQEDGRLAGPSAFASK